MIVQRVAIGLLAVLSVLLGLNLIGATSRFVTAYDTYDRIEMELTQFDYIDPDTPIAATFVVRNPTNREIEVIEIELGANAGVHRVAGGTARPQTIVPAGGELTTPLDIVISDRDYVRRLGDGEIDWRIRGRLMVKIDEDIEPDWIPFSVRFVPE